MKRVWMAAVALLMVILMMAACAGNTPAETAGKPRALGAERQLRRQRPMRRRNRLAARANR